MATTLSEGSYTSTIYGYIRDKKFAAVVKILSNEVLRFPKSQAALSLLGYCHFQLQDYASAASWYTIAELVSKSVSYQQLALYFPYISDYRLYYAQALLKAGDLLEAERVCASIKAPELASKVWLGCDAANTTR